ncbi:GRP family sugar transporter [Acidobacterium sp. S8]|uniref:GRP family sugar transporter n=1 Tax=Acidobacterium sp. S8 TaxID=1641854 RepID=UPI00131CD88C|nr:GRP family sugar transporter [Acidobacterium sp. S8]
MFQPETYAVALSFMFITMLCWGSWANTMKLCSGYRFQLFYWDYVLGLIVGALIWGVTLGSLGDTGRPFFADLAHADASHVMFAIIGGVIFNIANLLLVAAIEIAGLAVAFPVGIGLALVVGAISSYVLSPNGNPLMLFGGISLVVAAIVFDAIAYRLRETEHRSLSKRGVIISLVAGLLMGSFYPFVSRSMTGVDAPGPYAITLFFALGVAICAIPFNYLLMRKPLDGSAPVSMSGYAAANGSWHIWGIAGGAIWCTGAVLNFVASRAHIVGPAVSYSIGQGATMISAAWGVFVWREFASAPQRSKTFLVWMFVFFLCGLTAIALAPVF